MLKATTKKGTGTKIEIEGSLMDTVQDLAMIIHAVYDALSKQEFLAGEVFRQILMDALNDDKCPVWKLNDSEPTVMVDLSELARRLREE